MFQRLAQVSAFLLANAALALSDGESRPSFTIYKASQPIKLDAILDEEAWSKAEVISEFIQHFPYDTSVSNLRTEFRATYDDHFIYISAVSFDNTPGKYVISSLRRDYRGAGLDGITAIFDPFQDVTNAFFFGLSPMGVQREGLISNGYISKDNLDLSWDNKWYSASSIHDGYWIAEIAIPFKTLRFKPNSKRWNVKFYRQDSKDNERAIWPFTPRNFEPGNLNYTGEMIWSEPPHAPKSNVSVIPFMAANRSADFINDVPSQSDFQFGGDAKVAVTSSLNLDLTVNPDFSQVEVDQQVTNLDRFEIFFPEKRQFFLENADLFSSYGHMLARPFFSRRIGVTRDPNTGQNVQNRILFGARLSGNVNRYWRIGMLNMQTDRVEESGIPSYNYSVATAQRRIGTNSNLRAIFVNRQQFQTDSSGFRPEGYNYNRVAGLDYNYSFLNNKWTGNVFFHKQFTPEPVKNSFAHGYGLSYATRTLSFTWYHQIIGKGFDPAVGYVPRKGYKRVSPSFNYLFYPVSNTVVSHGPNSDLAFIWDDVYGYTDHDWKVGYGFNFRNNGSALLTLRNVYTYLFADFDPTNSPADNDIMKLPAFTGYTYTSVEAGFISDPRKLFNYTLNGVAGEYFNGKRIGLSGTLNYRIQPYGVLSMNINYNRIQLPDPYTSADIYLVGPRVDLTLTKSVFFTTFFQYNSQYNNMNINSRFQWRFKPVSDLFIVYTDNYFYSFDTPEQNFTPKSRAIVVKLTYWFNI